MDQLIGLLIMRDNGKPTAHSGVSFFLIICLDTGSFGTTRTHRSVLGAVANIFLPKAAHSGVVSIAFVTPLIMRRRARVFKVAVEHSSTILTGNNVNGV